MSPCHDHDLAPSTAYIKYSIIPTATVSRSQPGSHLLADVVVLISRHSHKYELTNELTLSCHCTSMQIDRFLVLLQSRSIIACKCISKLGQSQAPSASLSSCNLSLPVHLQPRLITASKCFYEFAESWPASASPNSLNNGLPVHL